MEDEQGRVRLGLDETLRTQEGGEATVPSLGALLEAVEGLVEFADQVGVSRVDKPNGAGCSRPSPSGCRGGRRLSRRVGGPASSWTVPESEQSGWWQA
jgi:hypothetical protein